MRPAGEISRAVRSAWDDAVKLATRPVPATARDVAGWLVPQGVGRAAVRHTVNNMARAGHLQRVGTVRVPGTCRPLVAYLPAWGPAAEPRQAAPGAALACITRAWVG